MREVPCVEQSWQLIELKMGLPCIDTHTHNCVTCFVSFLFCWHDTLQYFSKELLSFLCHVQNIYINGWKIDKYSVRHGESCCEGEKWCLDSFGNGTLLSIFPWWAHSVVPTKVGESRHFSYLQALLWLFKYRLSKYSVAICTIFPSSSTFLYRFPLVLVAFFPLGAL